MGHESALLSRRGVLAGGAAIGVVAATGLTAAPAEAAVSTGKVVIKKVTMRKVVRYTYSAATKSTKVTKYKKVKVVARFAGGKVYLKNAKGAWVQVPYAFSSAKKALVYSRYLHLQLIAAAKKAAADAAAPRPRSRPPSGVSVVKPTAFVSSTPYLQQRLVAPPPAPRRVRPHRCRPRGRPRAGVRRLAREAAAPQHGQRQRVRRDPRQDRRRRRRQEAPDPGPVDADLEGAAEPAHRSHRRVAAADVRAHRLLGARAVEQAPAAHGDGGLLGQPLQRDGARRQHRRLARALLLRDPHERAGQVLRPAARDQQAPVDAHLPQQPRVDLRAPQREPGPRAPRAAHGRRRRRVRRGRRAQRVAHPHRAQRRRRVGRVRVQALVPLGRPGEGPRLQPRERQRDRRRGRRQRAVRLPGAPPDHREAAGQEARACASCRTTRRRR